MFGQAGAGRLRVHELVGSLLAVTDGQGALGIEVRRSLEAINQLSARNVSQNLACQRSLTHVTLDDATIGLADGGNRLAGTKVDDFVAFQ